MVRNTLRSSRTPLCLCVLVSLCLCLFLLLRMAGPPKEHKGLPFSNPQSTNEFRRLRAELDLLKQRQSQRQRELDRDQDADLDQDLETLLRNNADEDWAYGPKCAPYPRYEDLKWQSPHFQVTRHGNLTYYLFGAYYDGRPQVPEVMVLAMITTWEEPYPETHCQMWFEGEQRPELVPLHQTKLAWYLDWGKAQGVAFPTLLTFRMLSPRIPQVVSLVFGNSCAVPQNALKVRGAPPKEEHPRRRLRVGVCLKYLRFAKEDDMSERLVEWLELMRLLGAARIRAYDIDQLHPNLSQTLAHYTRPEDGLMELLPYQMLMPADDGLRELGRKLNEVLLYNDCLYRSLYDFDYVAVVDVDEVIMPLGKIRSWPDLLEELQARDVNCTARCSYCFRNVYFPRQLAPDPQIPSGFHMLAHVTRVAEHLHPGLAAKCLHNTAYATVMHNHFALQWRESCGPQDVALKLGQMQHYRHVDKVETLKEPPPKRDDNIRRFQHQLVRNVLEVHRQLGWRGAASSP